MRTYLLVAAAAALALCAGTASATTYLVTKTNMDKSTVAQITGNGVNERVYLGMMNFTVTGLPDPVELFCIDPYHRITVGNQSPALSYHTEAFTHDFGGNTLSTGTIQEIAWLATYGVRSNSLFIEKAVQGAIWMELGFDVAVSDLALQTKMGELFARTDVQSNVPDAWVSDNGKQSFLPGAIPEPSTWALMILGFGGAGAMLRRQRRPVVA